MSAEFLNEWLAKAEEDYQTAAFLREGQRKGLHNSVCFHCQQAAKKYLKAYLVKKKTKIEKTHDLRVLGKKCAEFEGDFELISDLLVYLAPYAVDFRYPGDNAVKKDAVGAFKAAQSVREFVRRKIASK